MDSLQKELQALKAKVAEPVKWQPKGGNFFIQSNGKVSEVVGGSDTPHKEFGVERPARQQAQRAAVEMRRFNRLLALRDELCGDELVDWDDHKSKHYVYFSHSRAKWFPEFNDDYESLNPYFTNRDATQKACDMLNSGEVEL